MDELELIETLNGAVHKALLNNYHTLSEHQLLELADKTLVDMPTLGGTAPTAACCCATIIQRSIANCALVKRHVRSHM